MKIFKEQDVEFDVNGTNHYESLALNCHKIFRYKGAAAALSSLLIELHNGVVTATEFDADLILCNETPQNLEALEEWILMRNNAKLGCRLLSVPEFNAYLQQLSTDGNLLNTPTSGLFEGLSVINYNLNAQTAAFLVQENAKMVGLDDNQFGIWCGDFDEKALLKLHVRTPFVTVQNAWVVEVMKEKRLAPIAKHHITLPLPPNFHSVNRKSLLTLMPHPQLEEKQRMEFHKLCLQLGIKATENGACHGMIAPAIITPANITARNIFCLRSMAENGPLEICPPHHLCYELPDLHMFEKVSIVGIKSEKTLSAFIKAVLKYAGIGYVG